MTSSSRGTSLVVTGSARLGQRHETRSECGWSQGINVVPGNTAWPSYLGQEDQVKSVRHRARSVMYLRARDTGSSRLALLGGVLPGFLENRKVGSGRLGVGGGGENEGEGGSGNGFLT